MVLKRLTAFLLILVFLSPCIAGPTHSPIGMVNDRTYDLSPPMPQFSSEAPSLNFTIPYPVPKPSPPIGSISVLIIAVEFTNYNHTLSVEELANQTINQLNAYYSHVSYGQASIVGKVVGWVRLPHKLSYYGLDNGPFVDDQNSDMYPDTWQLLRDAIPLIVDLVNVTDYQQIVVVHAGYGQESSRNPDDIWSVTFLRWALETAEGVFDKFAIVPEFEARGFGTIGVYAHEFGHLLGLPDLYSNTDEEVGVWDLMARGAWNGKPPGTSPAEMLAWNRIFLGWIAPEHVQNVTAQARMNVTLGPIELASSQFQAIRVQPSSKDSKGYYLVEVRQQIGYDAALPLAGVLITYIDETKSNPVKVIDSVQTSSTLNDAPFQAGQSHVDSNNNVIVSVTGTDGSSFFVLVDTMSPRPEIVIQGFSINPPTAQPNETVTVSLEIANYGTLSSKGFLVNIYLNDTIFLSRRISLKPAQIEQITSSWTPIDYGLYVFKAEVDPEHLVTDAGADNTKTLSVIVGLTLTLEMRPPGAGGDLQWWFIVNNVNQTHSGVGEFQIGLLPGQNSLQIQSIIYLNPSSRYVFRQWSDGTAANPRTITVDADIRLSVDFDPQYLLSLEPNGGATTQGGWYGNAASVTVSAASPSNVLEGTSRLVFVSWSGDVQSNSTTITVDMTQPYRLIANWKAQYYLYIQSPYAIQGGGWHDVNSPVKISPSSQAITQNGIRHQFLGWTGDVLGTSPSQLVIIVGPTRVSAEWSTEYELRIESECGHVGGTGWYFPGASAKFVLDTPVIETTNGTRLVFTSWSGDFQGVALTGSVVMDAPKLVRANWETQYLVTLDTEGVRDGTSLTITVDGQPHQIKVPEDVTLWLKSGSSISFSTNATATQGIQRFLFVDWRNSTGGSVKSPQTVLKPETLTANYRQLSASPCIIATVTFGSELSPEVQFLRNFRDHLVLSTRAGSAFMNVFNTWYYSFSPQAADYIASHDSWRNPMRFGLYPLVNILALAATTYSALAFSPELAIVAAGIVASTLIGLTYLTPMFLVVLQVTKRPPRTRQVARATFILYLVVVPAMILGELAGSFPMLAFSSSALVLVTVVSTALLASHLLATGWRRLQLEARLKNASCRFLLRTSRIGNSCD